MTVTLGWPKQFVKNWSCLIVTTKKVAEFNIFRRLFLLFKAYITSILQKIVLNKRQLHHHHY